MSSLLDKSPIDFLVSSAAITPQEMSLVMVGLNPNMGMTYVPKELKSHVDTIRYCISSAVSAYTSDKIKTTTPCLALDILLAGYPFINESTPKVVIFRIEEAINRVRGTEKGKERAEALGGIGLYNYIQETNKSGRGQHRKKDEDTGTLKMMGLLIKLLSEKEKKYLKQSGGINITELYKDILNTTKIEKTNIKGIGNSTFFDKARRAIISIHDLDHEDES
ncbi:hypothetical protein [Rosenbergiella nectarea]|uniref:hypothetical protein n=1 Tax=Rosenbergiella nectarea TaxID=988801 RepID=UPI001BD98AEA|nr:hypothetical protein [Rosenbergiella nectarea]MBT0730763.1 hypothetical protein [Rosenbergiella nectarea subsp. apis]